MDVTGADSRFSEVFPVAVHRNEFEIIPVVGNHSILLGDVNDLKEKFDKLKIFYRESLNHTGWNQYSKINLKYENEVYCSKRGMSDRVDSLRQN